MFIHSFIGSKIIDDSISKLILNTDVAGETTTVTISTHNGGILLVLYSHRQVRADLFVRFLNTDSTILLFLSFVLNTFIHVLVTITHKHTYIHISLYFVYTSLIETHHFLFNISLFLTSILPPTLKYIRGVE